jgi:hypothetical protein
MLSCLVLAIHDLIVHPPSEALSRELKTVIDSFYRGAASVGPRLSDLADQYERQGGPLLSPEQALKEVDDRRGISR